MQLVQTRSAQVICMQTQFTRSTAKTPSSNALKRMLPDEELLEEPNVGSGVRANLEVVRTLNREIARLEREVFEQVKLAAQFEPLLSIAGIGRILALAIMLETRAIERFAKVGNFSSYARCVDSKRLSNDKKKGEGKCGNKYLAWALVKSCALSRALRPEDEGLLRAQGGQDQ
jgi:transposase